MMSDEKIISYKGFDANWKCLGYQFEVGGSYEHNGPVKACESGFHACEYPLDVFAYYSPEDSNFAIVEQWGTLERHSDDSKVASSNVAIKAKIDIAGLVKAAFEYTIKRCEKTGSSHTREPQMASSATGYSSASSATDDRSASSATDDRSASSATGDRSASSATGYRSASSATGYRSASSATGDSSASLTTGHYSASEILRADNPQHAVAVAVGYLNKARAPVGSAIVLAHRNDKGEIVHIRASKVGENGIKPDVWYVLNSQGEFEEASND